MIEMIDRPYRFAVNAGNGMVSAKLYIRSELGMYDPNRGDVELTLFAGIIPSRSAAKKDPVVALRTE